MTHVYEIKCSSRNAFEKRIEAAKTSALRLTNAKQILDIELLEELPQPEFRVPFSVLAIGIAHHHVELQQGI